MALTMILAICMALATNAIYSHAKPQYYYNQRQVQEGPQENAQSPEFMDLMRRATGQPNNNQAGPPMDQGNNMNRQRPAEGPPGNGGYSQGPAPSSGNGYGQGPAGSYPQRPAPAPMPSYPPQGPPSYPAPSPWGGYPGYGYQPNPWGGYPSYGYQPAPNYNMGGDNQAEHTGFHEVKTHAYDDKLKNSHTVGIGVVGVHLGNLKLNHQVSRKGQEVTTTYEDVW